MLAPAIRILHLNKQELGQSIAPTVLYNGFRLAGNQKLEGVTVFSPAEQHGLTQILSGIKECRYLFRYGGVISKEYRYI